MPIIDAHTHMISRGVFEKMKERAAGRIPKDFKPMQKIVEDFEKSMQENISAWEKAAEEQGLEKIFFMATSPGNKEFADFINASEKFVGIAKVNPLEKNAKKILEKDISHGFKGIKLYPVSGKFHLNDKKALWVFEFAAEKNLPIVIHSGVSLGYDSDLLFGNPLEIDAVARDYPDLKIGFAHFGTTFFREALMLAYSRENIFLDSSGKSGWIKFLPYKADLKSVFEKALEVFGSDRILFGSDTRIFPEGYRKQVLEQQLQILQELELNDSEIKKIFYGNAKRVFKI